MMKESNLAVLVVKFLVFHLELIIDTHSVLMKELIWVIYWILLWFKLRYLITHLDEILELDWDIMLVFMMGINMVFLKNQF